MHASSQFQSHQTTETAEYIYVAYSGAFEEYDIVTYSEDDNYFEGGYNVAYNKKDNNVVFNRG